jgi:hypothetical protein
MRTKLLLLALVAAATLLTGCQTRTAVSSPLPVFTAADVSGREILGGRIGLQVAAHSRPATLQTDAGKSRFANMDERAYLVWKSATRS